MIKTSPHQLQLHFSVLESDQSAFAILNNEFGEHLLACLSKWFYSPLRHDHTLAQEAVYNALKFYFDHPRAFNPEHGSLKRFLELSADRFMQMILERENIPFHTTSLDRFLARLLDNDRDILLARLVLARENDFSAFVRLLNIGSYRIEHQLSEIQRHRDRITKIIQANNDRFPMSAKRAFSNRKSATKPIP